MAKKNKKYGKKSTVKRYVEGDYNQDILNFLGEDVLRDFLADNNLAIAEVQKFSSEVRGKALHTIGLLATLAVALFVALYSIEGLSPWGSIAISIIISVIIIGMIWLFNGIVWEKENQFGGNSLKYLLPQTTIDRLDNTRNEKEKMCQHLYLMLKDKEEVLDAATAEVARMQKCYKQAMKFLLWSLAGFLTLSLLLFLLCLLVDAVFALEHLSLSSVLHQIALNLICS